MARGASTKRRSPGWITVLPRGGMELRLRSTTATIALRGRPELAHGRAGDGVIGRDDEIDQVELAALADLERRLVACAARGRGG